eukprot:5960616-Alexandrium_andersonii.AAC.1
MPFRQASQSRELHSRFQPAPAAASPALTGGEPTGLGRPPVGNACAATGLASRMLYGESRLRSNWLRLMISALRAPVVWV